MPEVRSGLCRRGPSRSLEGHKKGWRGSKGHQMYILGTLVAAALVVAGISGSVAAQQWTADDLYADRPFGNIEVGRAGIGQMNFQAFFDNLSNQQRAEIRSRCAVIGSDGRFAKWVRDICIKVEAAQSSA
jgi:hypothetical protein